MRVALFSTFYPYRGGIAQFGGMLYRALEVDNDVKVFNFKKQYPNFLFPGTSQFVEEDAPADKFESERLLNSTNPLTYRTTAKAINAFNPDVYISQYWMTFFGPALAGVQKRLDKNIKRVCVIHNMIPHETRFFDKPANKMFLKHNDGFVVMNDKVKKDLLSLKPDAKFIELKHPVYNQFGAVKNREEALQELGLSPNKKYALFFGFIRDYKGLDLLLEAMKNVSEDCELIVAGEVYGDFLKYQALIDANGLQSRVHLFNEYIADNEVAKFFSAADVCVLPYKNATQSGITAISHHFELPVIATDVGGLKENTEHMVTGLIVNTPEAKAIEAAVNSYFENDWKAQFQKNIQERKNENSWEAFGKEILEFAKTL